MKKFIVCLGLVLLLISLSSCGKRQPTAELLVGHWERPTKPLLAEHLREYGDRSKKQLFEVIDLNNSDGLDLTVSKDQFRYGEKKNSSVRQYSFNQKKAIVNFGKELTGKEYYEKVSFDASGNIMTLTSPELKIKEVYYRHGSREEKKIRQKRKEETKQLQNQVKAINQLWYQKQEKFIDDFTTAAQGNWDNKASNANVNLKHDSPAPEANFELKKNGKDDIRVSFSQVNKNTGKLVKFDQEKAKQLQIVYPEKAWKELFSIKQVKANKLDEIKEKISELTFRGLYMKLGDVNLHYYLDNHYSQEIRSNAYDVSVHGDKATYPRLTLSTNYLQEESGPVPKPQLTYISPSAS